MSSFLSWLFRKLLAAAISRFQPLESPVPKSQELGGDIVGKHTAAASNRGAGRKGHRALTPEDGQRIAPQPRGKELGASIKTFRQLQLGIALHPLPRSPVLEERLSEACRDSEIRSPKILHHSIVDADDFTLAIEQRAAGAT